MFGELGGDHWSRTEGNFHVICEEGTGFETRFLGQVRPSGVSAFR